MCQFTEKYQINNSRHIDKSHTLNMAQEQEKRQMRYIRRMNAYVPSSSSKSPFYQGKWAKP